MLLVYLRDLGDVIGRAIDGVLNVLEINMIDAGVRRMLPMLQISVEKSTDVVSSHDEKIKGEAEPRSIRGDGALRDWNCNQLEDSRSIICMHTIKAWNSR